MWSDFLIERSCWWQCGEWLGREKIRGQLEKTIFIVQKLKEKKGQIQGMFKRESTRHSDLLEVWKNKGMR